MFRRHTIMLLLAFGLVFPACRKDLPIDDDGLPLCIPTPTSPPQEWSFQAPVHTVNGIRFNPNDGDEIMFVERPYGSQSDYTLWRYRISTGALTEVLSGSNLVNMTFPFDWGSNGWILFNLGSTQGGDIFKVKSNGDSLAQVTYSGGNLAPIWSPSCAAYGYLHINNGLSLAIKAITATGISDTLTVTPLSSSSCWFEETKIAAVGPSGVYIGDVTMDQMALVCSMPPDLYEYASPTGITVLPDHQTLLWMHTGGLYRTNRTNGATEQLFRTCNSQYFVGLDYSPQTNKLLTKRIIRTPLNDHILQIATDIVLMNPDGTGQEVVNIPFPE